jgi:Holin of 3TMs, for gene-transfer release
VVAFFVLAPLDPLRFAQVARAYELMPDGFWALLSIIVAFYFGGRMQLKRQDTALKGSLLAVAREVLAMQRAACERDQLQRAEATHGGPRREPAARPPDAQTA